MCLCRLENILGHMSKRYRSRIVKAKTGSEEFKLKGSVTWRNRHFDFVLQTDFFRNKIFSRYQLVGSKGD